MHSLVFRLSSKALFDGTRLMGWAYARPRELAACRALAHAKVRLEVAGCAALYEFGWNDSPWRYGRSVRSVSVPDEKVVEIRDPEAGEAIAAVRRSIARAAIAVPVNIAGLTYVLNNTNNDEHREIAREALALLEE